MPTLSHSLSLLLPRHTRLTPRVLRTPKNQLSIGLIRIPAAMPVTRRGQQSASFSQMALLFPKISRHIIFAFQFPRAGFFSVLVLMSPSYITAAISVVLLIPKRGLWMSWLLPDSIMKSDLLCRAWKDPRSRKAM